MKLLARLSPYLSSWYVYIDIEYEQRRTLSLFSFEIIPFPRLSFPFHASTFVNLGCSREGLKRQISRRHANDSLRRSGLISELRHATRHFGQTLFGTWPKLFPRFSRYYVFSILALPKKWMETVRYGNSFARRRNPGCYCRTELTFRLSSRRLKLARVHRPIPELHLRKPVITFLLLPFPIDAAISEITLRINHRQPNRKLSQRSQLSLILG